MWMTYKDSIKLAEAHRAAEAKIFKIIWETGKIPKSKYMEKQDNKYFTPSIEDIRAGYECEIKKSIFTNSIYESTYREEWVKYIVEEVNLQKTVLSLNRIRTPYLTKEQLKEEGWHNFFNGPYSYSFSKGEYMVIYRPMMVDEERVISISVEKSIEGRQFPITLFSGKCRDINEFRTICKFLGI